MRESFETCLPWVLGHEGGYVNHPDDPGGATNRGVTQNTYTAHRKRKGLAPQSVRLITSDEVADIYLNQYWHAVRGNDLPVGLDYAVFDFAVNAGPSRATKELQKLLGVRVDGMLGEQTLSAVAKRDAADLVVALCDARIAFCKTLKNKQTGKKLWPIFGKGWSSRVYGDMEGIQRHDFGVIDRAIAIMIGDKEVMDVPTNPAPGKAIEPPRESLGESGTIRAGVLDTATKLGGIAALGSLNEHAQIIGMAVLGVGLLITLWIMRERVKAWADGWR